MAVVGFIFLVVILLWITLGYVILFINTMGKYNIGGVPNTRGSKILTLILGVVLMEAWQQLLLVSPFEVIIK